MPKIKDVEKEKFIKSLVGLSRVKRQTLQRLVDALHKSTTDEERTRVAIAISDCIYRSRSSVRTKSISSVLKDFRKNNKGAKDKLLKHRKYVAERIKELRLERKWTQQQLADLSGLPQNHICRIEKCDLQPTGITIAKIADAFGIRRIDIDPGFDVDDS